MNTPRKRSRRVDEVDDDALSTRSTSAYFTMSPSSAWGAVESLGTMVDVLSNYKRCFCMRCKDSDISYSTDDFIDILSKHFYICSKFRETLQGSDLAYLGLNDAITAAVSHLCPYNCFLRAFAPARKWYSLRSSIFLHGNTSPNKVLRGWHCYLSDQTSSHTDEIEMVGLKPKVHFVASNGQVFHSEESVMRALGCYQCTKSAQCTFSTKRKTLPLKRSLLHRNLSLVVESEIIAGQTKYGIPCNHSTNVTRRALSSRFWNGKSSNKESHHKKDILISPFGLLEELFVHDPWRLLLSTILLNRTCREQVDFVMFQLLEIYPSPQSMEHGDVMIISDIIRSLGIRHRRAKTLVQFSREYNAMLSTFKLQESLGIDEIAFHLSRNGILGLHGCGNYAADAYEIFILGKYDKVTSSDHALCYFTEYKRSSCHA
jgi:Predicted EndoIII-related endonuclease